MRLICVYKEKCLKLLCSAAKKNYHDNILNDLDVVMII